MASNHWDGMCEGDEFNGPRCKEQCMRCKPVSQRQMLQVTNRKTGDIFAMRITTGTNSFGEVDDFIHEPEHKRFKKFHGQPVGSVMLKFNSRDYETKIVAVPRAKSVEPVARTGQRKIRIPGL